MPTMTAKRTWRVRLQKLRTKLGLNQIEMAKRIGATPRALADWEMDKRSPSPVFRRAIEALEKSVK